MVSAPLFDWAIRATLLLAVALPLARLMERRSAIAAHRLLATVSLCILIVLPVCMTVAPGWRWAIPIWTVAEIIESPIDSNLAANRTAPIAKPGETETQNELHPSISADISSRPRLQGSVDPSLHFAGEPLGQILSESKTATSAQKAIQDDSIKLASTRFSAKWPQVMAIIWVVVTGVLVLRFASSINRLRCAVSSCQIASPALSKQVHRLSLKCGFNSPLQVLLSKPGSMPMACWLGRWGIVVPEDLESWPEELREVTLLHELGHIARRDAWADYLAQSVACVLWPNPIAWVAAADTRRLRERACDEWSLSRYSGDAKHYALSLIEVVRRCQPPEFRGACAIADKRGFESRLKRLFSCSPRNSWALLSVPSIIFALGLAVAVAIAEPTAAPRREGPKGSAPESAPVTVSSEPSPKTPVVSVSGTVKDEAGNPLEGASVVLRANLGGVQYAPGLQHARDVLARTKTDSEGRYEFSGIGLPSRLVDIIDNLRQGEPGVQVLAWAEGSGLQWKPVNSFDEAGLEFRLQNEADVTGVASDENGTPLADGELTVIGFTKATDDMDGFLKAPGDLNTIRSEVRLTGAIRDGRFSLANMPEDYRISVGLESRSGHRAFFVIDTGSGTSKEITNRNAGRDSIPVHRTPIRVTAKQQPWVQIKIVDDKGRPVAGGGVEAVDSQRHYGGSAAVGDDGIAILSVHNPGVHDVYYASDPLNPALGLVQEMDIQPDSRAIVEMRLPASRMLAGKVINSDTDEPVPGVYVYGGNADASDAKPRATGSMAVTGVDGRFEFPVIVGDYKLSIRHEVDGYFVPTHAASRDAGPEPEYPTVTVTAENTLSEVVIKIARGLVVNGTVLDEQGLPARGIQVAASCEGRPYKQTAAITDSDGHYHISGLSPYVPVRITAWCESGTAEETIAPTEDHPWEQTLMKSVALKLVSGTSVVGRVTQADRPVPGISVRLLRAGPPEPGEQGVRFSPFGETTTDELGKYRLTGLTKGDRYHLEVEAKEGAEVRDWRYTMPYSHTVEVENGETIELPDAELKTNGQTLSGVVVDPDGNPVKGITVSARLATGMHLSRPQNGPPPWTETDDKGRFKLSHLPDEPVSLMAYKANPAGGRILHPSHASPAINAGNIEIVFDPSLIEEPEDLD